MRVEVNGTEHDLPGGATVADAVAAAGVEEGQGGVAVAVDGEVIPGEAWQQTALAEGQRVEIVAAIQGGA